MVCYLDGWDNECYVAPGLVSDTLNPKFVPILDSWATASERDVHLVKVFLMDNPTWKVAVRPWGDGWEMTALQFKDVKRPEVATQVSSKLLSRDTTARIVTARLPSTGYPLTKELYGEMRGTIR